MVRAAHPAPGSGLNKGALEVKVPLAYCRLPLSGNAGSIPLALPHFQEKLELLIHVRPVSF